MDLADAYRKMMELGATPEMISVMLEAVETASLGRHKPSPKSAGALRTQRWREKQLASQTVTERHGDVTVTETAIPIEEGKTPIPVVIGVTPSPPSPRKTATRLPEDWRPKPLSDSFRASIGFDQQRLTAEFEQFRDHYLAKPGEKGRSMDWDGSWRTWLRNAVKWDRPRSTPNGTTPQNTIAGRFAKINAALDERIRSEGGDQDRGEDSGGVPGLWQGPGRIPSVGH